MQERITIPDIVREKCPRHSKIIDNWGKLDEQTKMNVYEKVRFATTCWLAEANGFNSKYQECSTCMNLGYRTYECYVPSYTKESGGVQFITINETQLEFVLDDLAKHLSKARHKWN